MRISFNDKVSILLFTVTILIIGYRMYASKTGQFEEHKSWVYAVDNKNELIVSASENELLFWNNRRCTDRLVGHTGAIKTIAFSRSGNQIVSGSIDGSAKVWSSSSKKVIKILDTPTRGINKVEFSNTGTYVITAGYNNKMLIWDWMNNKVVKQLYIKHTGFSVSKGDVLAYVDSTCTLTLFDLGLLSTTKEVGHFCGTPVFNPQKNIVVTYHSVLTFIVLNSNKVLSTLNIKKENSARNVSTFKFTPDGEHLVAGVGGGDIEIWNWQKKQLIRSLRGHVLNSVDDFSFNDKNQLISASGDRSLKFWNWETGDLKMVVGDGLLKSKLHGLLSISVLLTLIAGFWAMIRNVENKVSSYILLAILTVWTFGFGLILYLFKTKASKYATPIIWMATLFSGLFLLSIYGSWLSIRTIPVSLLFCHLVLVTDGDKSKIYVPLIINLLFCGILCSIVTSAGLWK